MDNQSLAYLIEQTKDFIEETYYGQSKIYLEGQKTKVTPEKNSSKVHLHDLFKMPLDKIKVALLVLSENPDEKKLIEKMGVAIDSKIAKARVFEARVLEENSLWEEWRAELKSLDHILVSEIEFYQMPKLMAKYQTQPKRQVFDVPLFLLADLSSYNRDIELKKSLWATLLKEL